MTGVDAVAAAVSAAVLAATRGVPPVMIGTIDRVDSGGRVWVTGLEAEQSAVMPVRWWSAAFAARLAAGTVAPGARVLIVTTTSALPVQLAILDLAVSAPPVTALGLADPL